MRRTLLTLILGIVLGAAAVAAPALSDSSSDARDVTLRAGDYVKIPTLDLSCLIFRSDPDGRLTGPVLYCSRYSTSRSWSVTVSRRWIQTGNPRGYIVWQHARLP